MTRKSSFLFPLTSLPALPFAKIYEWFRLYQRDLPWRKDRNPYRVWIAEIMLQQTRSEVVKGYYAKWLKTFPTLKSLATYNANSKASNKTKQTRTEVVLALWQGLGYYSRALNIIKTTDIIYREYGGRFPQNLKLLQKLPGIGPYTAGAILNFGFKDSPPTPMVDGNFERVFARIFWLPIPKQVKDLVLLKKKVWEIAGVIVHDPNNHNPQLFNEAIMELGASVCSRKNPDCTNCPMGIISIMEIWGKPARTIKKNLDADSPTCLAFKKDTPEYSPFSIKEQIINTHSTALVLEINDGFKQQFLLMRSNRRSNNTTRILKSLWRFPTLDRHIPLNINMQKQLYECIKFFRKHFIIHLSNPKIFLQLTHHYTKYKVFLNVLKATTTHLELDKLHPDFEWKLVTIEELKLIGMSSPDQKIRTKIISVTPAI